MNCQVGVCENVQLCVCMCVCVTHMFVCYQMKSVQWLQKVGCLKKRAVN